MFSFLGDLIDDIQIGLYSVSSSRASSGSSGCSSASRRTAGSQTAQTRKASAPRKAVSRSSVPSYAASPSPSPSPSPVVGTKPAAAGGNWFNGMGKKEPEPVSSVTIYSRNRTPMTLDESLLLAIGGEGSVYRWPLQGKAHGLVKLYKDSLLSHPEKRQRLSERLCDMMSLTVLTKASWLAWPRMACFDAHDGLVGFAMNRCEGHSFLSLFGGPSAVRRLFPGWDRRQLIKTAIDYVGKVKALADHQVFVNDFNPANFLVNEDCEVSFIDCDSYQVPRKAGGVHVTTTYFPSHVAPELLLDKSLLKLPRNRHHVEFGVAVVVFNLLMCGLHPYSYYDVSNRDACGTPDENLLKGRCPLGMGAHCMLPRGNWYNLWSWMPYKLKNALIGTFRQGHGAPEQRTSLEELLHELNGFLFVAEKDAERRNLDPQTAKPKDSKSYPGSVPSAFHLSF